MRYGKYEDKDIPIDILRMIVNKSRKYSLIILVNGHSQIGKTTFIYHIANRIMQIKKGRLNQYDRRNTWSEWDAKKFTATNAYEFVDLWDKYNNSILTLAEAGESLNYLEWFSVMAKVFSSTTRTQGYKRNICFLDTVMSTDIQKHNKENIDFRIWVYKRVDALRLCVTRNYWVEIDYAKDRWRLRWLPNWNIFYSQKELFIAKQYTDWVTGDLKMNIADKNKRMVGLKPTEDEEEMLREAEETQKWAEERQKNPLKVNWGDTVH
jgi:hypothetical protein